MFCSALANIVTKNRKYTIKCRSWLFDIRYAFALSRLTISSPSIRPILHPQWSDFKKMAVNVVSSANSCVDFRYFVFEQLIIEELKKSSGLANILTKQKGNLQ